MRKLGNRRSKKIREKEKTEKGRRMGWKISILLAALLVGLHLSMTSYLKQSFAVICFFIIAALKAAVFASLRIMLDVYCRSKYIQKLLRLMLVKFLVRIYVKLLYRLKNVQKQIDCIYHVRVNRRFKCRVFSQFRLVSVSTFLQS